MGKIEKIPARHLTKVGLCHLENSELEPQFQKYKVELHFEVMLQMIEDHTQYLLNKDHQHHR